MDSHPRAPGADGRIITKTAPATGNGTMLAPRRDRRRCDVDEEPLRLLVDVVSVTLLERTVTKAERDAWQREDEERDRRRVPLGFRLPG